jgi:hypothetical protein
VRLAGTREGGVARKERGRGEGEKEGQLEPR